MAEQTDRRRFMSSTMLGTAGAGALLSLEEKSLQAATDQKAAPSPRPHYQGETLPQGKIGKLSISRLLMGGNLIGGYAHSRDLLYVSRLLREYNTDSKIFETFELAEQSGVNMIQVSSGCVDFVVRYRKERGGKIQMMVCVDVDQSDAAKVKAQIREFVDKGVETLYTHGERTDRQVMAGNVDAVGPDRRPDQGGRRSRRDRQPLARDARSPARSTGSTPTTTSRRSTPTTTGRPRPRTSARSGAGTTARAPTTTATTTTSSTSTRRRRRRS